jgi:hypothetical protein
MMPGLSLFAKINGRWNAPGASTTRSARICQTRMRAALAGGIPKVVASPLNGDDIILVVQAHCSAPAQISEVSMRENIPQGRW